MKQKVGSEFFRASINRIRLEFKDNLGKAQRMVEEGINRIRLEFKAQMFRLVHIHPHLVLIESDWNLKVLSSGAGPMSRFSTS